MSGSVVLYRLHAAECIEIAQDTADETRKLALLSMAQSWLTLADHIDRQTGRSAAQQQQQPQGNGLAEKP
jgi:hypothetical protein